MAAGCTSSQFLVSASGNPDGPQAFLSPAQTIAPGSSISLDGPFAPNQNIGVALTNVPAPDGSLSIDLALFEGTVDLFDGGADAQVTGGSVASQISMPDVTGVDVVWSLSIGSDGGGEQSALARSAIGADVTMDFSTAVLPQITSSPTYDPTSASVIWTEAANDPANTTMATFTVNDGASRNFQWVIAGPHTGPSIEVPTLPSTMSMFNIMTGDQVEVQESWIGDFSIGWNAERNTFFGMAFPTEAYPSHYLTAPGQHLLFAQEGSVG